MPTRKEMENERHELMKKIQKDIEEIKQKQEEILEKCACQGASKKVKK